jgi:ABC-type multidrug transport system fused ATPase/permease subunit
MSHYVSLDKNLNGILIFVKENIEKFSPQARQYIEMTESTLVTRVLKRIYGSTEIKSILMIENFESNVAKRIGRWDAKLTERERKVESYNKELQKHESAFNFVGLYEGFENLMKEKQKEQTIYVGWIIFLGVAIIAVLFAKILSILISPPDATDPITYLLCASILALLAALLYFFRIALLNFKSIKSQILQIQLRQTLCRFIQGYVDYKRDGEKLGKVDLSMFEKLIFSNIVAGEEQIPSTFDSLDHLASIIKTIKS